MVEKTNTPSGDILQGSYDGDGATAGTTATTITGGDPFMDDSGVVSLQQQQEEHMMEGGDEEKEATKSRRSTRTTTISTSSAMMKTSSSLYGTNTHEKQENCIAKMRNSMTTWIEKMIKGFVVVLSVRAAKYPYWYIGSIVVISIAVVAVGFSTNFNINIDREVLFTPTNSLAMKHLHWIKNFDPDDWQQPPPQQSQPQPQQMDNGRRDLFFSSSSATTMPIQTAFYSKGFLADVLDYNNISINNINNDNDNDGNNPRRYPTRNSENNIHNMRNLQISGRRSVINILIHKDGENVITKEAVTLLFDVLDEIQMWADCSSTCYTYGATRFWDFNKTLFEQEVSSDEDIAEALSNEMYPDGAPVDLFSIAGKAKLQGKTLISAESLMSFISLPSADFRVSRYTTSSTGVADVTMRAMLRYRDELLTNPQNGVKVEYLTIRSYDDELMQTIVKDLPLIPAVAIVMVAFTCMAFFRCHFVHSKCLLAVASIVTISLSIMTAYGILFMAGIPFTPMTLLLPFLVYGIGLDDTFIITGAYNRTDPNKDPVERIKDTMDEVGLSISITTITTTLAFLFGLISTIPAIYWLCLYAFPTIMIDFIYQITFFVAILVLDSRRIQANRSDFCTCFIVPMTDHDHITEEQHTKPHPVDLFMDWYSRRLIRPKVRNCVVFLFTIYFAISIYFATKMTQEFKITDLVPSDSYVRGFLESTEKYTTRSAGALIWFRHVDQSDENIRRQMINYIDDLVEVNGFGEQPPFCWVKDLWSVMEDPYGGIPFTQLIDQLLELPIVEEVLEPQLYRDEEGNVAASRCLIWFNHVNFDDVRSQVNTINEERAVSASQPINKEVGGEENWPFFVYSPLYPLWEFYNAAVEELISTTLSAVAAVCLVALIIIPYWSAVFFIVPMVCMLYAELIGTLQFIGVRINVVSYVSLVISIGLMVDFIVHVLIKYYESRGQTRQEKVQEALSTMGTSILLGGMSTLLATVPLLFSSSAIFSVVFSAIFAMVLLSIANGLVFLPAILTIIGPIN